MAQQTIVQYRDDIDPNDAADLRVGFAVDGKRYEIDLKEERAKGFLAIFEPYLKAARNLGRDRSAAVVALVAGAEVPSISSNGNGGNTLRSDRADNAAIRAWGLANGFTLAERGRIPLEVVEAFAQKRSNKRVAVPADYEGQTNFVAPDDAVDDDTVGQDDDVTYPPEEEPVEPKKGGRKGAVPLPNDEDEPIVVAPKKGSKIAALAAKVKAQAPEFSEKPALTVVPPKVETKVVRAWAKQQGIDVPARGVLRPEVITAFNKAH